MDDAIVNKLLCDDNLAERKTRYKYKDEGGQYRLTTRRDSEGKKYRARGFEFLLDEGRIRE